MAEIQIKRYNNRKLYDTVNRCYVTLEDIADYIANGNSVRVVDHESGQDLTTMILAQVIVDQERRLGGLIPRALLTRLIRIGEMRLEDLSESLQAFLAPQEFVNRHIRLRLERLRARGDLSEEEFERWLISLLDPEIENPEARPEKASLASEKNNAEIDHLWRELEALERAVDALARSPKA
ncbi:polyhydroxyalkanoate synthesis regulator DNA-binding domain-containing protein [Thermanaerothrix sp.]|jgi:polyhydroxyalkanoate synthesis repressor PhaR|uniref:polyhydroxyalkanoate synthesis regulator DNA-binding domain-containing protein n=1 Tax=Thermanaerothrix sp. TaxID=2972675 RepID=UPI002ADE6AB2|nr:polyhydroxyalkanoate synthesis regulator DNA-binding domain-containing protein [Thermanaerothrix sp.]